MAVAPAPNSSRSTASPPNGKLSFQIRRDERAIFVGRTGSGKTTLADKLIRFLGYRFVVIDPKHMWDFPGYARVERYDPSPSTVLQVFRPHDDESDGWADTDEYLDAVWSDPQPTVLYVDELTRLVSGQKTLPILKDFVRLGRQRRKGTWYATQRPKDIPSLFLSEADHWFVFDLRYAADRDKCVGFLGDNVGERITEDYAFWYSHPKQPDAFLMHQ